MLKGKIKSINLDAFSGDTIVKIEETKGLTYIASSSGNASVGDTVSFNGEWNGVSYKAYDVKKAK